MGSSIGTRKTLRETACEGNGYFTSLLCDWGPDTVLLWAADSLPVQGNNRMPPMISSQEWRVGQKGPLAGREKCPASATMLRNDKLLLLSLVLPCLAQSLQQVGSCDRFIEEWCSGYLSDSCEQKGTWTCEEQLIPSQWLPPGHCALITPHCLNLCPVTIFPFTDSNNLWWWWLLFCVNLAGCARVPRYLVNILLDKSVSIRD
jgi:hypothetical protein